MSDPSAASADDVPMERPGPTDNFDPVMITEGRRAILWCAVVVLFLGAWYLAQPLLVLFGGVVFATMLDGGTRLLGRVLPIRRSLRLTIVLLLVTAFLVWVLWLAGTQLAEQFASLRQIVTHQMYRAERWAESVGLIQPSDLRAIGSHIFGSLGRVTSALGSLASGITDGAMIIILGAFLAIEPETYKKGAGWLVPLPRRARFYATLDDMGYTLRRLLAGRLLGMAVEGVGTGVLLWAGGIPMATLLGVLTGMLAFLPNIGAFVSGGLIILVGFSQGLNAGLYAILVYVIVQILDGYVIVPYVARKSVDIPGALLLAAQILLGAAFGLLGLMFADSLLTLGKVALAHVAGVTTLPARRKKARPGPRTI